MNVLNEGAIFLAGVAAGGMNAVVGSGSLITFPALVALGYPPVVANVSNNVGLVPGSVAGTWGYRRELEGQQGRLLRLGSASVLGSLLGASLLITLPPSAFKLIVPVLILIALILVVAQTRFNAWLQKRQAAQHPHGGPWLWLGVFAAGVYGGYFGAAQGVILIGLLGIFLAETLQRVNAAKNALSSLVNGTAAIVFMVVAKIDWTAVLLIAVGSTLGGLLGSSIGRKLSPVVLRGVIVVVGLAAFVKFVAG